MKSPLNVAEGVLVALLGLNLKIKGTSGGGASGKVDAGDLLKAQVHGGLMDVDEAPLQGIEEARGCLIGASDALSTRVAERK